MGDYHQGMGLAAGMLMLTLDDATVVNLLHACHKQDRYVPNIWRAESIVSATDGYVFLELLKEHVPAVGRHLLEYRVPPETFVQKWFCALCVHVLPFEALIPFFSSFFQHGHIHLFRFGLALVDVLQQEILNARDEETIYALLRLDAEVVSDEIALKIVTQASDFALEGLAGAKLTELREEMFDKHLKGRLLAAAKAHSENLAARAATAALEGPCEICTDSTAEYYCANCKKMICEECRDNNVGGHDDNSHHVAGLDEREEAEEALAQELLETGVKEVELED